MRKQNLPLYPKYVMKNHQNLFAGALRQHGSWDKALIAAVILRFLGRPVSARWETSVKRWNLEPRSRYG